MVQPYEFECSNVIPDCDERLEGETREDVLEQVATHMREHHGFIELPSEMTRWVLASVRPEDE
jgi:predicted small metal-binding protein